MDYVKGYAVTVLAVVLFSALCEVILPENGMKKYTASLIGLAVIAAVLSPIVKFTKANIEDIGIGSETAMVLDEGEYQKRLTREYENRITSVIKERAGGNIVCSVLVNPENMRIKKVYIKGTCDESLINFIINELGVLRNDIEIIR